MQLIIFNYLHLPRLLTVAFADTTAVCQQPFALADNRTISPNLRPLHGCAVSCNVRQWWSAFSVYETGKNKQYRARNQSERSHGDVKTSLHSSLLQLIQYNGSFKGSLSLILWVLTASHHQPQLLHSLTADHYREHQFLCSCKTFSLYYNCRHFSLTKAHFHIIHWVFRKLKRSWFSYPTGNNGKANESRKKLHAVKHMRASVLPWPLALWTQPRLGSSWRMLSAGPCHWRWLSPAESHSEVKSQHPGRRRRCPDGCPCLHRYGKPGGKQDRGTKSEVFWKNLC